MRKHLPRYDFTGRASRESKMHKMNISLFVKRSTSSARPAKDEKDEDFVRRLTHLKLQDKNIKVIENLDVCVSLQVLYDVLCTACSLEDPLVDNDERKVVATRVAAQR